MNDLLSLPLTSSVLGVLDVYQWTSQSGAWLVASCLGGLLIVLSAVREIGRKPVIWVPTNARLLNCKVVVKDHLFFRSRCTVETHYRYSYEVNGSTYQSTKVVSEYRDPFFSGGNHARRIATKGDLCIFYNQRKPEDSALTIPANRSRETLSLRERAPN
jgi:hypothetical protein